MPWAHGMCYRKRQGGEYMWAYLSNFGIFTHKGLIRTGEIRWKLIDVQHMDSDSHPTGQNWTVWMRKHKIELFKINHSCGQCYMNIAKQEKKFTALTSCGYMKYYCLMMSRSIKVCQCCRRMAEWSQRMSCLSVQSQRPWADTKPPFCLSIVSRSG